MTINRKQAENIASVLSEGLPYIQKFKNKIIVVKYGGAAMVETKLKERHVKHLEDLANLPEEPAETSVENESTSNDAKNEDIASNSDSTSAKKSKQDEGPILTAMQQAMQQAQARQEESSDEDEVSESNAEAVIETEEDTAADTSSSDENDAPEKDAEAAIDTEEEVSADTSSSEDEV